MNALAIHLYLRYYYINLNFNNFGIFYRTIANIYMRFGMQFTRGSHDSVIYTTNNKLILT